MKISLIIPTYNASRYMYDLLNKLKTQTIKYNEIIVIDSSSMDNTIEIAESFKAKTIIIPKEQFDHGGTRNAAAEIAEGDILVYLTQDAIPADERSLEYLLKPLDSNNEIAAIYGRQLPSPGASPFSAHLRLFNYPECSYIRSLEDRSSYGIKTIFFSDSFSAYKREALEKVGRFKSNLIFGEDTHAAAKLLSAGYKIAYATDARVYHSHNYSALQEFKRYFDLGVLHSTESWIIEEFGKAKGEGKKYIKSGISYLIRNQKHYLIPSFIFRNTLKYMGYNLGLRYLKLPGGLAKRFSMNTDWWEKFGQR